MKESLPPAIAFQMQSIGLKWKAYRPNLPSVYGMGKTQKKAQKDLEETERFIRIASNKRS